MEKIKNKFVVLAYVLLMVGMLFYIDVTVVKKVEKELEDAENTIECLNIQLECSDRQILDLKREKSKQSKINDSLINRNPYIVGKVSWYGGKFHGRLMANGKIYDKNGYTAASPLIKGTTKPKYPFGTKLRVENVRNGKSVVVTITDTGGFAKYGRELDLSKGAFDEIADLDRGIIKVKIEMV